MVRLTVLYDTPPDEGEFLSHYESTHVPLVHSMPGVDSFQWGPCVPGMDGAAPKYFLTAELQFASEQAMQDAFGSPKGQETLADAASMHTGMTLLTSETR